jgi:hypothetical protein
LYYLSYLMKGDKFLLHDVPRYLHAYAMRFALDSQVTVKNELLIAWWSVVQAPVGEQMFVLEFGESYQTVRSSFLPR